VFTPFWRALRALGEPDRPLPAPRLDPPGRWPEPVAVDVLDLLPRAAWAGGLAETWSPGEAGAAARLDEFADRAAGYADTRDRPALPTSQLSPHLHFGEVSPRRVWHAVRDAAGTAGEPYLRQLGWREFAHHLLFHFPHTAWRRFARCTSACRGGTTLPAWRRGGADGRATCSSTPACASSGRRAGCTTASAW
jgi:deoxyribodipyrimidine photo-lyase